MFREGSAAGRIPHVGHGVAVVGVLGLGATAQQVVGEGDVVRGRGVAAAGQAGGGRGRYRRAPGLQGLAGIVRRTTAESLP